MIFVFIFFMDVRTEPVAERLSLGSFPWTHEQKRQRKYGLGNGAVAGTVIRVVFCQGFKSSSIMAACAFPPCIYNIFFIKATIAHCSFVNSGPLLFLFVIKYYPVHIQ